MCGLARQLLIVVDQVWKHVGIAAPFPNLASTRGTSELSGGPLGPGGTLLRDKARSNETITRYLHASTMTGETAEGPLEEK